MGKLRKRNFRILTAILLCLLLLCSLCVFLITKDAKQYFDFRSARIDVNWFITDLESSLSSDNSTSLKNLKTIRSYPIAYILIDLDGNVVWAQGNTIYHTGEHFPLKALSGINAENVEKGIYQYVTPILIHNRLSYTAVINLPAKEYLKKDFAYYLLLIPAVLLLFLGLCLVIGFIRLMKNSIFEPLAALHKATNNILLGDLETPLTYDYDDETGILCHDFEAMRAKLLYSSNHAKQLKDNEKLLLACISHDLKTPLASISAYVEGIIEEVVTDKEDIKKYAYIVMNKVKILSKLIDDILEHSKTELDELSIHLEEVYSKKYFTDIFTDLSMDVAHAGIDFQIDEIPDFLINIDPQRIRQVICNIIFNSIKFTSTGGIISVNFFTDHSYQKEELVISIKDTGKGIGAADLPFIFDKFYRGEKARTLNIAGSGLGLNISRYIVTKHGGHIECDSILDVGTTIMFSLPL